MNFFLILLASSCLTLYTILPSVQSYEAIINFGDSITDTGNYLLTSALKSPVIGKFPYGMTFFHHPTGRCSDGRVPVDFLIAISTTLPSTEEWWRFYHGVNFAVAGATALDPEYFYERKIGSMLWTNYSLNTQLVWFKKLKSSFCNTKQECDNYLKKALFLVRIGGNDYNYPFFAGTNIEHIVASVPLVVDAITTATSALIEEGAVELMVSGNLPFGCSSIYLTLFQSPNKASYDARNGCLKAFNAFSEYHNYALKRAIGTLRQKYPQARIIYGDYYGAAMAFYNAPQDYGFKSTLTACCGGGGPYNFNISARCGYVGSKACKDPWSYVSWDGIHLTDAAYGYIAKGLMNDMFNAYL